MFVLTVLTSEMKAVLFREYKLHLAKNEIGPDSFLNFCLQNSTFLLSDLEISGFMKMTIFCMEL